MRRPVSIGFIFLLAFGASAMLNVAQHSWSQQDKQALRDELSSLQSQAKSRQLDVSVSPTPTPSPTETPLGPGQDRVTIAPYGVKLVVTDPIKDLVYGSTKSGTMGFATQSILAKYSDCKAGALGELVRTKAAPSPSPSKQPSLRPSPSLRPTPSNQPFKKTVGGYTYTYRSPTFSCVNDKAGRDLLAAAIAAVKNQALPTISDL